MYTIGRRHSLTLYMLETYRALSPWMDVRCARCAHALLGVSFKFKLTESYWSYQTALTKVTRHPAYRPWLPPCHQ